MNRKLCPRCKTNMLIGQFYAIFYVDDNSSMLKKTFFTGCHILGYRCNQCGFIIPYLKNEIKSNQNEELAKQDYSFSCPQCGENEIVHGKIATPTWVDNRDKINLKDFTFPNISSFRCKKCGFLIMYRKNKKEKDAIKNIFGDCNHHNLIKGQLRYAMWNYGEENCFKKKIRFLLKNPVLFGYRCLDCSRIILFHLKYFKIFSKEDDNQEFDKFEDYSMFF